MTKTVYGVIFLRLMRTLVSLTLILALAFSFTGSAGFSYAAKEPGTALFDEYCICRDCRTCQECITCDTCDACEACYACQECNTCEDRFLCGDCYTCEDCYLCDECYICEDCITCNYCRINEEPCTGDEFCNCEDCYTNHDFANIDEEEDDFANVGEDEDDFANIVEDEDGFVNIDEDEDGFIGSEAIEMASQDLSIDKASQALSIALIESSAIEQFVTRLYRQALGREPTQANLKKWTDALKKGDPAATVTYKVFFSKEFLRRNVSNDSFIEILYRSLLDREPDSAGRKRWRNRMAAGLTREEALARFIKTVEFTNYCKQAGIVRGTYKPPPGIAEHTKFVMNMYRGVLGREPKQEKLQVWIKRIRGGRTGALVAQNFIYSGEAKRRNRSDEQYVDSLYRGLLGREPDSKGRKKWLNRIKAGWPREDILAGFIKTAEFKNVCKQAGVVRGTYKPPPGGMERVFMMRMYREALGREPNQADLKTWVDRILAGRKGASVANSFIFGNEIKKRKLTDAQFVDTLYRALWNRAPDSKGRVEWQNRIKAGWPRENVFARFINSNEYTSVCKQAGVVRGTYKPPAGGLERVFVTRLYKEALGREPSQTDLKTWVDRMVDGRTAASVSYSFIFGNEMMKRKLTDAQYVDALYRAMLGRKPSSKNKDTWVSRLQSGTSRYNAFVSFVKSSEFSEVCKDLNIKKGTAPLPANSRVDNTIEARIWNLMVQAQFSGISDRPEHIAGIIGNLRAEAGPNLCPFQVEVSNQVGLGLMQWSYGRRTALENYMWSNGISATKFRTEMNKHLTTICNPASHKHPQDFLNKVLQVQINFMFHELRNTSEREYMKYINYPKNKTEAAGARAYAELFCALALRPGPGWADTNDILDAGVKNARKDSPYGGTGVLERISFSNLSGRRTNAELVYQRFLASHN